jgi:hypothetical protein
LFGSLFADWRLSPVRNFLILFGALNRLGGSFILGDRTGWQLYSVADILLAGLAFVLLAAAVIDRWQLRAATAALALAALVFAVHALLDPPGLGSGPLAGFSGVGSIAAGDAGIYPAIAGPGETLAIVALVIALLGLALGIDRSSEVAT